MKLGRLENAIRAFDKAIGIKPDSHTAWSNKGRALDALGRHEEAIKAFDLAKKINNRKK